MSRCVICGRETDLPAVRFRFVAASHADVPLCSLHRRIMDIEDVIDGDRAEPTQRSIGMPMQADAGCASADPRPPHLGESVLYRSRTGDYTLAAKVSRTCRSSSPEALHRAKTYAGLLFMEPLELFQVDLTVFTPGGSHVDGNPAQWTGTYAEHHISYDPLHTPGTWCRIEDLVAAGKEVP